MTVAGARTFRPGWWPDRATVGLVIAGFFGIGLVAYLLTNAGTELGEVLSGTLSAPPSAHLSESFPITTTARVSMAAFGSERIALGVAGVGGMLVALRAQRGVVVAVAGLGVAVVARLADVVTVTQASLPTPNAAAGFYITAALTIVGYIALAVVLYGGVPLPRFTPSEPAGPVSVP